MASFAPTTPTLPASWSAVLDRIQDSLEKTLRLTEGWEHELPACRPTAEGDPVVGPESGQELASRPGALEAPVRRAAAEAEGLEQSVAGNLEACARWLQDAADLRRRLANLGTRPV